jgi:hypothetical protein
MDIKFQMRFSPELHAKLTEIAQKERRSIHSQILLFLERACAQWEKENTGKERG